VEEISKGDDTQQPVQNFSSVQKLSSLIIRNVIPYHHLSHSDCTLENLDRDQIQSFLSTCDKFENNVTKDVHSGRVCCIDSSRTGDKCDSLYTNH
jgi:hypothetical protein